MAIAIHNFSMPKSCWSCPFSKEDPFWCSLVRSQVEAKKAPEYVIGSDKKAHHNGHLSRRATENGKVRPDFCPLYETEV